MLLLQLLQVLLNTSNLLGTHIYAIADEGCKVQPSQRLPASLKET